LRSSDCERLETTPSTGASPTVTGFRKLEQTGRMAAWVYILECADLSFYVGSTVDLEARVWQHQNGEGAAYTRHRLPVRLLWSASYERIDEAFGFEKQVQGWSRAKRPALIEGRLGDLGWLSSRSHAAVSRRRDL
jgi:putative endonuclease